MKSSIFYVATALMLLLLPACGESESDNPATYPVTGTVIYQGSPVENATVVLTPIAGNAQGAMGNTDAEGKFSLTTFETGDGALPGEYKVRVFKYEIVDEPDPTSSDEIVDFDEEEYGEDYTGTEEVKSESLLPSRYENAATSGITHTVPQAPSTLEIDI